MDDPFASLSSYEFMLLTTFRESGVGVPTAMWFAHEHGKLYMVTGRTTGKLKRIRTTSRVLLAPCDLMGNVLGPQIEAYAYELTVAQHAHANALLAQKYGEQYEMDASEADDEDEETFIELASTPHSLERREGMSNLSTHFIADVRHPIGYPDLDAGRWFQWRSIPMIELSALDTYQFVKSMLPHPAQTIMEVGCGNGYLCLELARDGHEVLGIDVSPDIIEVAERSSAAHPHPPGFGSLRYLCTDVNTWQAPEARFDCVIFNRSLHHISALQQMIAKVQRLLKQGGRIICQDYAYDRFDEQTACWLYQMQRLLFLSGHYDADPATLPEEAASIEALRTAWLKRASEHHLNRYEEMMSALQGTCHEHFFAWAPYLFVYIGNGIRQAAPEQERELLTFLKRMEQYLIDHGAIQAVGFRFVGSV